MKVTIVIEGEGVIIGDKPEGHALAAAIRALSIIGPVTVKTDASSAPCFTCKNGQRGLPGNPPCRDCGRVPMSSETVSDQQKGARRARAEKLATLLEDMVIRGNSRRHDKINRIEAAFEEEFGLGLLTVVRKALPYTPDPNTFDERLEAHRKQMEHLIEHTTIPGTMYLAGAVQFLLAIAHQPKEGGVVEIGGSVEMCTCGKPLSVCRGSHIKETP